MPPVTRKHEPRWPVAAAVLAAAFLLGMLPGRISLFPSWMPHVVGFVVIIPIIAVSLFADRRPFWLQAERVVLLLFFLVAVAATTANLTNLVNAMIERPADVSGVQLLSSSIGVWITNVIAFSLLYWQIDREGPEARLKDSSALPDWLFPQESAPDRDVSRDWHPIFIDYLYLGFSTATAFSTTDAMPLTPRAKLLMMLEASVSLATIVVVASRAINILGS
jgi:hypothetical protein